jgi:hypothetical protein
MGNRHVAVVMKTALIIILVPVVWAALAVVCFFAFVLFLGDAYGPRLAVLRDRYCFAYRRCRGAIAIASYRA